MFIGEGDCSSPISYKGLYGEQRCSEFRVCLDSFIKIFLKY